MKTAGMTFNRHIRANFPADAVYPGPDDTGVGYWVIERLREAVRTQRDGVRVWRGHFPYFVARWVPEAVTLTLLREPVARTVSLLEQRQALEFPDRSLEELYEDPGFRARELGNHQTKIFSLAEARRGRDLSRPDRHRARPARHREASGGIGRSPRCPGTVRLVPGRR